MGLDMYLDKKTYVQNWDHYKPEQRNDIEIKLGGKVRKDIKVERITYITEQIGYWRKANQIHAWFVTNVQDGQDDCRDYYVSREKLSQLLELCQKVLEEPDKAPDLLPTQSGFFFGDTQYGPYYIGDIKSTIKILKTALAEPEGCSFSYNSSW